MQSLTRYNSVISLHNPVDDVTVSLHKAVNVATRYRFWTRARPSRYRLASGRDATNTYLWR